MRRRGGLRKNGLVTIARSGGTVITRVGRALSRTGNTMLVNCSNLAITRTASLHHGVLTRNIRCGMVGGALAHVTTGRLGLRNFTRRLRNPATLTASGSSTITPTHMVRRFVGTARGRIMAIGTNVIRNRIVSTTNIGTVTSLPGHRNVLSVLLSMLRTPIHGITCTIGTITRTGPTRWCFLRDVH